jgi:hypothetical protein
MDSAVAGKSRVGIKAKSRHRRGAGVVRADVAQASVPMPDARMLLQRAQRASRD